MLQSFFFFFFWEIKNCCHFIQITGKSADIIKIESGETDSIETCKGKETFTIWAKTCVIALWNFCLLVWNFYTKLVPSLIKDVDTLPYRPIRSEFFVPVDESVQKHLQNVLLKIPAYIGQYRPYRSIPDVWSKKRNLAGTKTKRKNRRNTWFEQITVLSSFFLWIRVLYTRDANF